MNGADNGAVDTVRQTGNANHLIIEQSGSYSTGNRVQSVTMLGNNNGLGPDGNGDYRRAGTLLFQSGNNNVIQNSYIEGDGNIGPSGNSNTYRNTHRIEQRGNDNGNIASSAVTYGSSVGTDYNRIWVFQNGNRNNFGVLQGLSASSTGNHTTITQTGDDNFAVGNQSGNHNTLEALQTGNGNNASGLQGGDHNAVTAAQTGNDNIVSGLQGGDHNTIDATQTGNDNIAVGMQIGNHNRLITTQNRDGNIVAAAFIGDFNGSGAMSGNAGGLVSASAGLMENGLIAQDGFTNSATLTVTSSSNMFAFHQIGDSNTINGTVGLGDDNQVAIQQAGNLNISAFTQNGGGNNLAVSQ